MIRTSILYKPNDTEYYKFSFPLRNFGDILTFNQNLQSGKKLEGDEITRLNSRRKFCTNCKSFM